MSQDPARVFVSCGQRDCCEKEVANRVKDVLEKLGYEPYLAVDEQSLRSLRENIFERLRDRTEYFLFVDFCREKIGDGPDCRGSLFSHQELAIASFLDFGDDFLAFQELPYLMPRSPYAHTATADIVIPPAGTQASLQSVAAPGRIVP